MSEGMLLNIWFGLIICHEDAIQFSKLVQYLWRTNSIILHLSIKLDLCLILLQILKMYVLSMSHPEDASLTNNSGSPWRRVKENVK